jgi:hypothetical protein
MPNWKLTIDGTEFSKFGATTIKNIRPENNISSLEFTFNDYKSRAYSDLISKGSEVQLDLACKTPSLHTTFIGEVVALNPVNNPEILTVYCEGYERAYKQTYCNGSFGVESANPTKFTPREIIQDLTAYYVEFSLDTANLTNWAINDTDTYVDNVHNGLSVTNLTSKYLDCFTLLNRLCDVTNAYAQTLGTPEPGIHWYAEPNTADGTGPYIFVKEICDDHTSGDWDRYYGGSQTNATVVQGSTLKNYSFHQTFHDFANNVVLACALRKPAYDYWTENAAANGIWTVRDGDIALSDDSGAGNFVVGANSLKLSIDASMIDAVYYDFPSNINTKYLGSQDNVPSINFFAMRTSNANSTVSLSLYTNRGIFGAGDQYTILIYNTASDISLLPEAGKWYGITIPIGPYWKNFGGMTADKYWEQFNSADWTDLDGIQFHFNNTGYAGENYFWIDDLHFSGKIIREARDAGAIDVSGDKERQVFLRLDTAVDDSCSVADNTGTAARLAASELFKRSQFKTTAANIGLTGTIVLNGLYEDLLPGQQLRVHAGKRPDGTYRYNLDMRIKQLTHSITLSGGYSTSCEVTSDLWNSSTFDTPSAWGIYRQDAGALGHAEARDLKASGVDIGIPRLTWDPTA